ncbi:MAG: Gfo/Idh/MocA family oxidoreductase [Bryobacterales bacterium]|nr:Gfo/Idh/MocA family oxidoreductase [Bryobacterales bacterium]
MNRRVFFLSSAGAALAQVPSDTVRLALIGSGGRGRRVMSEFKRDPNLKVHGVCDVYEPNLEAGLSAAGPGTVSYRDYRKVLDDAEVDAVLIATPEHWHHRMTLDAMAAGKDVYVEKPLCHTPEEGKELVEAERSSDRIVQVGMQRRSYNLYLEARDMRREGRLGTVRMVRTFWLNSRTEPRRSPFEGPIDWKAWVGPAPEVPKDPLTFFNWRSLSAYSGGIAQDQGCHIFDSIHLIMDAGYPISVTASALEPHVEGMDLPESVVVAAQYPDDFLAVFTINYNAMRYAMRADQLNAYDGSLAPMDIGREFLRIYGHDSPETTAFAREQPGGFAQATIDHVMNFLHCVRTRETPRATMAKGFQAALIVQLANISIREGRKVHWNAETLSVA